MNYIDKKPGLKRCYVLSDDKLIISGGKWLCGSFNLEYRLTKIKPEPDVFQQRDQTNCAIAGLPGLMLLGVVVVFGENIYGTFAVGFWAMLMVSVITMGLGFWLGGKMKVALFKSHDEVPLFDVASRGNDLAEFDEFVSQLKQNISKAKDV